MSDFIKCNADLHMHGLYSRAVSKDMVPSVIAEQAPLKGLHLVSSSDILHLGWQKLVKEQLKKTDDEAIFLYPNGTKFILGTELECSNRVHHLIFFPSMSKVDELRERLKGRCKDFEADGRQKLWVNSEELAALCREVGALIGFAHAFTPYFGLFGKFDSYKKCYGAYSKDIRFMELGLSADTNMADRISELHDLTFLSNSDGHSPWPNKLGREFNELHIKDITFDEIKKALWREGGRKCTLNVGFNPLEGKYHKTRCTGCLKFFDPKDGVKFKWRCPECKKPIKKGVDYRIEELSDVPVNVHPDHRPAYKHIMPLSEIIALAIDRKNVYSDIVQDVWKKFIAKFGNEIRVLFRVPYEELQAVDENIANYIIHFREEKIQYIPGGAGQYGKLVKPGEKIELDVFNSKQKSLADF